MSAGILENLQRKQQDDIFARLPTSVFATRNPDGRGRLLSSNDITVLVVYATYGNYDKDTRLVTDSYPSMARVQAEAMMHERKVRASIQKLVAHGLMRNVNPAVEGRKANYTINTHALDAMYLAQVTEYEAAHQLEQKLTRSTNAEGGMPVDGHRGMPVDGHRGMPVDGQTGVPVDGQSYETHLGDPLMETHTSDPNDPDLLEDTNSAKHKQGLSREDILRVSPRAESWMVEILTDLSPEAWSVCEADEEGTIIYPSDVPMPVLDEITDSGLFTKLAN